MKKLLLLAIGLLILGATAMGVGVYSLNEASRLKGLYEEYWAKSEAAWAAEAAEATRTGVDRPLEERQSETLHRTADNYAIDATDSRNAGWNLIAGAVVLIGAGVLVLFAHRRRALRTTGAGAAQAPTLTKQLVIAIILMLLGVVAGRFSIDLFTEAAKTYAAADRQLTRAEEALNRSGAAAAPPAERREAVQEAEFATKGAARSRDIADEVILQAWLFTAGTVVLVGSGVLILLARRRRLDRATADATATQMSQYGRTRAGHY